MARCPSCEAPASDEARYCGECGTSLAFTHAGTADPAPGGFRPPRTVVRAAFAGPSDRRSRFLPGTILSRRYRVLGLLGRGGMGEVYRADDLKLGQSVALKFLSQACERDASVFRRFLNEVRLARQIAHPNVCRVYDVAEADGQQFISMEYVDGENLASLLRRIGRLPRDKAAEIARQICLGLAAAHDQGILHRDLKPANVMIDGRGQVRITDFGLAALSHEIDSSDARSGTPAYMAPEQLAGTGVTVKSDLYAVGLVLYELFTGRHAYETHTPTEQARHEREATPTSPSDHVDGLDPAVERIIMRCLAHDPHDRPSSARAIAAALPGAPPLQAAIAAGLTPSPSLVAEGLGPLGLRPVTLRASLAASLVGLAVVAAVAAEKRFLARVTLDKPQGYLIERAREVVRTSGVRGARVHEVRGYELARERPADGTGPGEIVFWYRQSARPLVPTGQVVGPENPPLATAGEARVRLDARGRLRSLERIPAPAGGDPGGDPDAAWTELFREAGLERADFAEAVPEWYPPAYADARAAWVGTLPGEPAVPARIEAAALRGRPVFFRLAAPGEAPSRDVEADVWSKVNVAASSLLFLPVLVVAVFFARRNLAPGRGDRKGAFRLATFMLALWLLFGILSTKHSLDRAELELLLRVLSRACLSFGVLWILYVALEPYARRTWPGMLVSWVRLLDGRWKDPLVGWHFLVGVAFGCVAALIENTSTPLMRLAGFDTWDPGAVAFQLRPLVSFRHAIAGTLKLLDFAVTTALQIVVVLLVLRLLVHRQAAAVIGVYLVMLLVFAGPMGSLPAHAALIALFLAVLFRFGLLAMISALFVFVLLGNYLISLAPLSPFAPASYLALSVAAGVAAYGFHFAWTRGTARGTPRPSAA